MESNFLGGKISVVDSTWDDYVYVLKNLANGYKADMEYSERVAPNIFKQFSWEEIFKMTFENTIISKTVLEYNTPLFIIGVAKLNDYQLLLHNISTEYSIKHAFMFCKYSKDLVKWLLELPELKGYNMINHFRPDNEFGLKWARYTGAKIADKAENGFLFAEWS